jgi:hypothetical protein
MVLVKAPVFGHHKGMLQKGWNIMKGHMVMNVPPVLVGHCQGDAVSVQDLNFADVACFKIKGDGQGVKVVNGLPGKNACSADQKAPDDEDCNVFFACHFRDY